MDQQKFMQQLNDFAEYAALNGNVVTKTEIDESFAELNLNEEQTDLLYQYLFGKGIRVQGIKVEPFERATVNDGQEAEEITDTTEEDSKYLQLYLDEIEELCSISESERRILAVKTLQGDEQAMAELLNASLYRVVEIAKEFSGKGVYLSDLIQEGNIALIQVLKQLTGKKKQEEPLIYIDEAVRVALAEYIDGQVFEDEEGERVLAKLGLLHEASKVLAKENGVLPTAQELADYTHMDINEIEELTNLAKEVDFLGKDVDE